MRKDGVYERLRETGRQVREALVGACNENGIPVQSCGDDTIFDVYFSEQPVRNYRDTLAADAGMMAKFNQGMLRQGILKSWPNKFYPSLAHTSEDVEKTVEAFRQVVPTLQG